LCGFSPPHLGQGSLLRNALLPAQTSVTAGTLGEMVAKLDENIYEIIKKD
jgi:hypothetical protein